MKPTLLVCLLLDSLYSWKFGKLFSEALIMRHLQTVFKLFILFLFYSANAYSIEMSSLLIKTVDNENQPIDAEIVNWWFADDSKNKKTLKCKQNNCSEWLIKDTKSTEINVYALASKVKMDDPYCWDFFEGKAESQVGQQELKIVLSYSSTVCK